MGFEKKVAVLGGSRTPFVRSQGLYLGKTNQDLLTLAVSDLVRKNNLQRVQLGDVIAGAVMNHPFDWNLTREVVLGSGLHPETPGLNIQRACGTGLEAVNLIALKIAAGQIEVGIAGGSDTNSDIPLIGQRELTHFLIGLQSQKSFLQKVRFGLSNFRLGLIKPQLPPVCSE
jgi:acetyl-CoA C-acetyltransferase